MEDVVDTMSDDLKQLAQGLLPNAMKFSAFNINGYKFRTLARENGLKTQNSGIFMTSTTRCISSHHDVNGRDADLPYYGKLIDIIELNYYGKFVTLFKCMWADTTNDRGFRKDAWGFNAVNFNRLIHTGEREEHEPFIYASQAQMAYYVEDQVSPEWSVVVHLKPRDVYDMGDDDDEICEHAPFTEQELSNLFENDSKDIQLAREEEDNDLSPTNLEEDENILE